MRSMPSPPPRAAVTGSASAPRLRRLSLGALIGLALCFAPPSDAQAAPEGVPCTSEPTDMTIGYGTLITCAINVVGDSDLFRFPGTSGEKISLSLAGRASPWTAACMNLLDPGLAVVTSACANTIIGATLPVTGTYTIQVYEYENNEVISYNLGLQRLVPPTSSATFIPFGITISDEINPVADTDLFVFEGHAADVVNISLAGRASPWTAACMRLRGPDAAVVASACANTMTSATLPVTGTYTIDVYEYENNETISYNLQLNCLSSPSCGGAPGQPAALPPPPIPPSQVFSCGVGFTSTRFGVTSRGTIGQFESPAGAEHYQVGAARSGYQICKSSGGGPYTTSWDFGQNSLGADDASGWQPGVTTSQPNGPGTFPLEITRTTAGGALTITRRITGNSFVGPAPVGGAFDTDNANGVGCDTLGECGNCTNRTIHVLTRITNNTGAIQSVRVVEMVDVDASGTIGSDIATTTADSATIGATNAEGVVVQALVTAADTAIRPYGGFGSNAPGFSPPSPDCDITTPGAPTGPGDHELAVRQEVTIAPFATLPGSVRVHHRRY